MVQELAAIAIIEVAVEVADALVSAEKVEQGLQEQEAKDMFQTFGLVQQIQSLELEVDLQVLKEQQDLIHSQDLPISDLEEQQITLLAAKLMVIMVE